MKKELRRVDNQKELGELIQRLSKSEELTNAPEPRRYLSVNDGATVAKAVSNCIKSRGYDELFRSLEMHVNMSKIKDGKEPTAMAILALIFKDSGRWTIFSTSKKMMRRIIKNDKTPVVPPVERVCN